MKIEPIDPRDAQVTELIHELDQYQAELYPEESNHLEPVSELAKPHVYFVAAIEDKNVLGIGAFMIRDGNYVEIKRLYVPPRSRKKGIARLIMTALENKAVALGYATARLETGIHQKAAIRLYEELGYRYIAPFGSYVEDPLSRFMEKRMA